MRARGRFIARAGRSSVRALSRALRVRAAVQGGAQCSPLPRSSSLLREALRSVSTDEPCPGALAEQNAPKFSRLRSVVASLRSAANCSPLSRTSARQTSSPQRLSRCGGHRSFPAAAPRGSVLVVRQRSAQLSPTSGASVQSSEASRLSHRGTTASTSQSALKAWQSDRERLLHKSSVPERPSSCTMNCGSSPHDATTFPSLGGAPRGVPSGGIASQRDPNVARSPPLRRAPEYPQLVPVPGRLVQSSSLMKCTTFSPVTKSPQPQSTSSLRTSSLSKQFVRVLSPRN